MTRMAYNRARADGPGGHAMIDFAKRTWRNILPVLVRVILEFGFQCALALLWASYQAYDSPNKVSVFITQFSGAFFILTYFTGHFFRINYQQNLFKTLDAQSRQIEQLKTTVAPLPALIENLKSTNAPAPVINDLSKVSDSARSQITEMGRANTAAIMSWWYQQPDFIQPMQQRNAALLDSLGEKAPVDPPKKEASKPQ
jgi:hypothetical protein